MDIQPYKRPTKTKVVTLLVTTIPVRGQWYPFVSSDDAQQVFVLTTRNGYVYHTYEELRRIAETQHFDFIIVGYSMVVDGHLQQYINDPKQPDRLRAFEEFQRWLEEGLARLNEINVAQTQEEPPAPTSSVTMLPPPNFMNWARVAVFALLVSQIGQLVVALAR